MDCEQLEQCSAQIGNSRIGQVKKEYESVLILICFYQDLVKILMHGTAVHLLKIWQLRSILRDSLIDGLKTS